MEIWKWDENHSVGNIILDEQNKYLLQCINELTIIDHPLATYVLEVVSLYARNHFDAEEELLKESHFKDFDKHHEMHESFLKTLGEIQGKLYLNAITTQEIQDILLDWYRNHICVEDVKYKELLENLEEFDR